MDPHFSRGYSDRIFYILDEKKKKKTKRLGVIKTTMKLKNSKRRLENKKIKKK
jgi:hypothetical protein